MASGHKNKVYALSHYLVYGIIPCCNNSFLFNPHSFKILDTNVYLLEHCDVQGRFQLPLEFNKVFSWISENADIILSTDYLIKGWKRQDSCLLEPVCIARNSETGLSIFKDLIKE